MALSPDRHDARRRRLKAARQKRWRRRISRAKRLHNRLQIHSLTLPPIVAEIHDYSDLLDAIKTRRHALHLSQEDVDLIAGFTERYTSKLEMGPAGRDPIAIRVSRETAEARRREPPRRRRARRKSGKGLGEMSLPTLLQALGVKLVMVARDLPQRAP